MLLPPFSVVTVFSTERALAIRSYAAKRLHVGPKRGFVVGVHA